MQTSEQISELAAALAIAQGQIEAAPKDSVNPHFKSRYADLASCWAAAREPLAKNGLCVVQAPVCVEETGFVSVESMLLHKSGQWIRNNFGCKPRDIGPQGVGAAATYLRRYGFCALVGVVADEDDDGNAAQGMPKQQKQQAAPPKKKEEPPPAESEPSLFDKANLHHKKALWVLIEEPRTQELALAAADLLHGKPLSQAKAAIAEARIQTDTEAK
jgi:hypothetical protein